jgi:hypothetical protein
LRKGKLPGAVKLKGLEEMVSAFNKHQDCMHGMIERCKPADPRHPGSRLIPADKEAEEYTPIGGRGEPKGYAQIRLHESVGTVAVLTILVTLTEHTKGITIDTGVDTYQTAFVRKSDLVLLSMRDGQHIDSHNPDVHLLVEGSGESCLGNHIVKEQGHLVLLDSTRLKERGRWKLPPTLREIKSDESGIDDTTAVKVTIEEDAPYPPGQAECEVASWARTSEYSYTIRCDDKLTGEPPRQSRRPVGLSQAVAA